MVVGSSGGVSGPEVGERTVSLERLHRWWFARELAAGRRVLALGPDPGAAARLLDGQAAALRALPWPAGAALPAQALPEGEAELLLCLEDAPAGAEALAALRRALAPGGLLLLGGAVAPLQAALRPLFAQVAVLGQHAVAGSLLLPEAPAELRWLRQAAEAMPDAAAPERGQGLVLASDAPLPPLPASLCQPASSPASQNQPASSPSSQNQPAPGPAGAGQPPSQEADWPRREAELRQQLAEQTRLAEIATRRTEQLRQRGLAIESSTFWRASAPLRAALSRFPGLRRRGRAMLRSLYHASHRLRHLRARRRFSRDYQPLVSVIVPNYNHARFLPQRIDSILGQRYRNIEVILLDDASTDDSAAVIRRYAEAHPGRIRAVLNEANSGNVFRQWRRGVAEAKGELIWICESDDFADPRFLERLVPVFTDESVLLGFGRIQFADAEGRPYDGLDAYRERAEPGLCGRPVSRPAKAWFDGGFGVSNLIANVGGCLIRNQPVEEAVWQEAATYRILGDWFLYATLSRGGRIAYEPQAVSYFRQHGQNTSAGSFTTEGYYREHARLLLALRRRFGIPEATVERFHTQLEAQFGHAGAAAALGSLSAVFDSNAALAAPRETRHVLMVTLGFYLGGGEMVPIHLANALVQQGHVVSMLALMPHDWNPQVRAQLDRRVAVYHAEDVRRAGPERFLAETGVTLIHSHFVGGEHLFLAGEAPPPVPYVVTLHGSYEFTAMEEGFRQRLARGVDCFVYLTPRNLQQLGGAERQVPVRRIPNGMALDDRPFPQDRAALGIGEDELVFALASRAIPDKGWGIAVEALRRAQPRSPRRLRLLLAGEGPEADRLRALPELPPGVHLLGFQERIHGLYRLADVVILPTRFAGESHPLGLIQAMQVGRPVIATDVGEIRGMLLQEGRRAGLVLPAEPEDGAFAEALAEAMLAMADEPTRAGFGRDAAALGEAYGMERVAAAYLDCYAAAEARHAGGRGAAP
ncbi:glycosyltransferase [Pseudoroseomonas cervicalis]|uniref:glycosyltransferase n=1 Tax=Teichococcus cervicalis TaxID=204525 RepID=UPI002780FD1E|nr:glycosyltransferase [Pseudoroseomonas cervicalis]MDQ1080203.1 glycosyltransferase involved in cell wall biosynthesis [Pseudoroseomonas cervicalis]